MKKVFLILLVLCLVFTLAACSGYTSSYSAIMMIRKSGNDECSLSFDSLKGTVVLNTKKTFENELDTLHLTATLDAGELRVYYAPRGEEKILLASVKAGESIDIRAGEAVQGEKIQIIIEAEERAEGGKIKVDFN